MLDASDTKAVAGGVFDNQGAGLASQRKDSPEAGAGAGYTGGALGAAGALTSEEGGDKSGRGRPARCCPACCWRVACRCWPACGCWAAASRSVADPAAAGWPSPLVQLT
jgi:hypothetical protein